MSIVIIGAGEMGYHLARRLSYEKKDVIIMDRNAEKVHFVNQHLDVQALVGPGSSPSFLRQAGIEKAGILVAVTNSDEANLVACYVAGQLNRVMKKVARLRHEYYLGYPEILDENHLGIDLVISPENEAVDKLFQVLQVPSATDVMNFADGRIKLFGLQLTHQSPLVGLSLMDLRAQYPKQRILIPAIFRESEVVIPTGRDVLKARDTIYVIAAADSVPAVVEMVGLKKEPLRNFMILGGTTVGVKIAHELEKQGGTRVSLIEAAADRCEEIAAELDHTMVLNSDNVDEDFLRSENISEVDAFLAMTDDDEHNALTALLAKRMGATRVSVLTNRMEYHRLVAAIGVDIVVNPRLAGASRILQYIRKGKVISVATLPGEGVEAIEFEAMESSQLVHKPLRKVKFPSGAILGAVERGREFLIPHGDTVIEPGDRVVFFARREAISKVENLVTVGLEYF